MNSIHDIIIRPVISEKSVADSHMGKYTFIISIHATKTQVKYAVAKLFNVGVIGVTTTMIKGTKVRARREKRKIMDSTYKKARVQLKKGEKISLFDEPAETKKS